MLSLSTRSNYRHLLDARALDDDNEHICLIYIETGQETVSVSRALFRQMCYRYALGLQAANIGAGDVVIIASSQSLMSIYAFWGALLIGAIPSMFAPLTPKLDRQLYMQHMATLVHLSDVRAIITSDDLASTLSQIADCDILTDLPVVDYEAFTPSSPRSDAIAFLQHSSGTTGLQKGVALSHEAVLNQLAAYSDRLELTADDVVVSWLPLYHDMGLIAGFLLPLIQGIPLVLMSPFDWVAHPSMLLQAIDRYQGTLCWLPNFAYHHMARRIRSSHLPALSLASIRAFINCSEPAQVASHDLFSERFKAYGVTRSQFAVSYAMAENTFAVTQSPIGQGVTVDVVNRLRLERDGLATSDDGDYALNSCGQAIENTQVQIMGVDGNILEDRQVGEIVIKSDCLLQNYYKRPDLSPFDADGWYHTGDMGYIAGCELYVIGRKKDIILNAGKNVYPQDIEAIVNTVEGVYAGRCVAFGVYDKREGTELIAIVAEKDIRQPVDDKLLVKNIKKAVVSASTVSATYVTLVKRNWLIKTSSGKIARQANREKWCDTTQQCE